MLSEKTIKENLKSDLEVLYFDSIDSTNTKAKELLKGGKENDFLVVANEQTNGRGRQGKSFYSPNGTGIYMSVAVHPAMPLQNVVTSTTAASVAVCKAIEKLTDIKPKIKWVNDIYIGENKICGILTESVTDLDYKIATGMIIGIGLNIKTTDFPKDILNAGSLGVDIDRAKLIATIADELLNIVLKDYSNFIDYYREHSMLLGKEIYYIENGEKTYATAVSIDDKGGLVVETQNGIKTLRSGEITVRQQEK